MSSIDIVLLLAYSISFICALLLMAALFVFPPKIPGARGQSVYAGGVLFFLGAYTVKNGGGLLDQIQLRSRPGRYTKLAAIGCLGYCPDRNHHRASHSNPLDVHQTPGSVRGPL
ncbi:hypothetical protein ACFSQ7_06810 [Paenibacillus rhizoplanae]